MCLSQKAVQVRPVRLPVLQGFAVRLRITARIAAVLRHCGHTIQAHLRQ